MVPVIRNKTKTAPGNLFFNNIWILSALKRQQRLIEVTISKNLLFVTSSEEWRNHLARDYQ